MSTERLQKILARGGFASRRAAERLISEGRVRVNGRVVTELGSKADTRNDKVEVDGARVVPEQLAYVVFHKPRGVVTTLSDPEGRPSVKELLAPVGARMFPVGRLDFATSGVMLATNDGDFAEGLMHPKKAVPKTYVVKVAGKMEPADLDRWRNGVKLEDGMTLPATAKTIRFEADKTWFELTIREGRNQQIRRMGEATSFPVMRLARVSFAGITSEGLRPGEWRPLTREELVTLKKEYGVPKRIVSAEEPDAHGRGRAKRGISGKHAAHEPGPGRGVRNPRSRVNAHAAATSDDPRANRSRGARGEGRAPSSDEPRADARGARRGQGRSQPSEETRPDARGARRGAGRSQPSEETRGDARGARRGQGRSQPSNETRGDARGARGGERPTTSSETRGDQRGGARGRGRSQSTGGEARGGQGGSRGPARAPTTDDSRGGPRYGGGSPGRRGYDVRSDWGGGAGRGGATDDRAPAGRDDSPKRGSSGGSRGPREPSPPRADVGGRGGKSRTTGTGGGIGARDGDYRQRGGRSGR